MGQTDGPKSGLPLGIFQHWLVSEIAGPQWVNFLLSPSTGPREPLTLTECSCHSQGHTHSGVSLRAGKQATQRYTGQPGGKAGA